MTVAEIARRRECGDCMADGERKVNGQGRVKSWSSDKQDITAASVLQRVKSFDEVRQLPLDAEIGSRKGRRNWQAQAGGTAGRLRESASGYEASTARAYCGVRGEMVGRSFAHCYEAGGLRRLTTCADGRTF